MAQGPPLKKIASGPQPQLEKLPPETLTPILSHSASIYSPKQAPTLTLPSNFRSQVCGQLEDQDPDGLHVGGGLGDVDLPTRPQALGVG